MIDLQSQTQEALAALPASNIPTDPAKEVGPVVLFIDQNQSYSARIADLVNYAKFARAYGVDTIAPKRADGSERWYGTTQELAAERAAVLAEGVGYMPFAYCYGPKFGDQQVRAECDVLAEIMSVNNHCVCADLESEWNGQFAAGQLFEECMRPVPGLLYLTTFGDPRTMNFPIRQIAPAVNAWLPQDYDNYLASLDSQEEGEGMTVVQPALDLSGEFGPNNVPQIAAKMRAAGHKSIWLWDHAYAAGNVTLLQLVVKAFTE
jgi:hypothetical protein